MDSIDKATKYVTKTTKLIILIIGSIVAIFLALFAGLDKIAGDAPSSPKTEEVVGYDNSDEDEVSDDSTAYYQDYENSDNSEDNE